MNTLQSRKQLLIAESELNRAQLVQECETMSHGLRSVTDRAKSFSLIASSAAVLVAGLAALRRARRGQAGAKPSWVQSILRGAGLISQFWLAFRSSRRGRDES